jgi:hypothetical protein
LQWTTALAIATRVPGFGAKGGGSKSGIVARSPSQAQTKPPASAVG